MPDAHFVPFRDCKGRTSARGQSPDALRKWWTRFAVKWHLPIVTTKPGTTERKRPEHTMVLVRHWVKSTARKAGVSKPARLAMQGHGFDPGDMDDRYDNPEVEELLDDQRSHLPEGTVGRVLAGGGQPLVQVMFEGVPREAVSLLRDYFEPGSQLTTREAWDRLEAIRLRVGHAGLVGV